MFSLEAPGKNPFLPRPGFWRLPEVLGIPRRGPASLLSLPLSSHGCSMDESVSESLLSLSGHHRMALRAHAAPLWFHFNLPNFIYNNPISKQGHILGPWVGHEFGGRMGGWGVTFQTQYNRQRRKTEKPEQRKQRREKETR